MDLNFDTRKLISYQAKAQLDPSQKSKMALSMSGAAIISTILESLLYGFSVLLYILSLWILLQNRYRRRPNYKLIVFATILQILAGALVIDSAVRLWIGFVNTGPDLDGGPDAYFIDVTRTSYILKGCLFGLQTQIFDGAIIYRTYVVWGSIYSVIIPILCWLGLLASSIGSNYQFATTDLEGVFAGATAKWITAVYALTLGTNLSASGILAYRIWSINRDAMHYRSTNRLSPVLYAVIESGALYSVTITIGLFLFVSNSVGVHVLFDMISPIMCISFHMIIVRVAFAGEEIPRVMSGSGPRDTTVDRTGDHHGRVYTAGGHELRSLAIQITQHIETHADRNSLIDTDRKVDNRLADDGEASSKPSTVIA